MNFEVITLSSLLFLVTGVSSLGRVFTNVEGKKIEAEFVSATATEVVLQLKKNSRTYSFKIEKLSKDDVEFIVEKRKELALEAEKEAEEAERKAILKAMSRGAKKVVEFVEENEGKKIGDGECWTLANEAYKDSGLSRPGSDLRVWGRVVDWKTEDFLPGDILELKATRFSNGQKSAAEHTAIVMKRGEKKGQMTVYHQNWGAPGKKVSKMRFDLNEITAGEAIVYRYGRR